jgi:hypothetical protein
MIAIRDAGAPGFGQLQSALSYLKGALNERDSWEVLAAADEAKEVSKMSSPETVTPSPTPTRLLKTNRTTSRGRSGRGNPVTAGTLVPPKIPRRFDKQVYFHHGQNATTITSSTTSSSILLINVTGAGDPNYASNSAIFDCFWILKLKVSFQNNQAPGSTVQTPSVYMAPEYEGITPPNLPTLKGYNSLRWRLLPSGKCMSFTIVPRYQDALALGSASDVGWLTATTASGTALWNGIAIGMDVQNTAATYPIQIEVWTAWSNGN